MMSVAEREEESHKLIEIKAIITGINYLMINAEKHGLNKISRILHNCSRDIAIALENGEVSAEELPLIIDHNMLAAISFLAQYASIDDKQLKQQILSQVLNTVQRDVELN